MGDLAESVASGSNTFAPKAGSAGAYESDTLWSAGVATDFSTGVGRGLPENGLWYAEADTRRAAAILPPLPLTTHLGAFAVGRVDQSGLANRYHFAEAGDRLFLAVGRWLYEWQESTLSFVRRLHLGMYATSIAYFDGYFHIAGYREEAPQGRDYLWVRGDDFSYGFDTPAAVGISTPLIFHVFGGLLYCCQDNAVWYTAGSGVETDDYPGPPNGWAWEGPIRVGSYGDEITGLAGLIYQQLGQRYVYVSTQSYLHVILPGDIPFGITAWPMTDARNGVGMKTFYNRIYIPVAGDLLALQANGDLIASGVDNSPEGLPRQVSGDHFDLSTASNMPFVTLDGERATVWAGKASSWHFVGKLDVDEKVAGSYYSAAHGRLFVGSRSGKVTHWYLGNTVRPVRYDERYRYVESGVIDSGWYSGNLVEQHKYWHSAFVDAGCLDAAATVELLYLDDDDDDCHTCWCSDYDQWHSLGYITHDQQELPFGYQLSAKRIRVAARLHTTDPTKTPEVRAIGVRYTPRLIDRNRWSITVKLPKRALYDANGGDVEDYNQRVWDDHLASLRKRETPVRFRDLDGKEYWVLVTGASRRVHSVGVDCGALTYDIDWSFALTEVASL